MSAAADIARKNHAEAKERLDRALDAYRQARLEGKIGEDPDRGIVGNDAEGTRILSVARAARADVDHWHRYLEDALKADGAAPVANDGQAERERRQREAAEATARLLGERNDDDNTVPPAPSAP